MPNIVISSLRGGLNDYDPPMGLRSDQCTVATNVTFQQHPCGARRSGSSAVDLTGAAIAAKTRITWLFRHLPNQDDEDAQLWALGHTSSAGGSLALSYKDTSWHDVTISDTAITTTKDVYRWAGASHGVKLFTAYNSDVDRLHVWDGTSHRRVGLGAMSTAPTAADTGAAGTLDGNRYYRVRETVQSGGVTILRSEPSSVLTHNPPGNKAEITVTKPTTVNSNATHWELEASLVLNGDYYILATTAIGTTTVVDTTTEAAGYSGGTLSEEAGQYNAPHSARLLLVDDDRLLLFGSFEDADMESSVSWTPVTTDDGVGNDERLTTDPVSVLHLDAGEGGKITAAGSAVTGEIWVFKLSQTYLLTRTYNAERAYEAVTISKTIGAITGSVTAGTDEMGRPCVYFLDPAIGQCRARAGTIQYCGRDVRGTWATVELDAAFAGVASQSLFDPTAQQVINFVAVTPSVLEIATAPNTALVLQTTDSRTVDGGEARGGWAKWDDDFTEATACCLFSDNIDTGQDRSLRLVPFIGKGTALVGAAAQILRLDPDAVDDEGSAFEAEITTGPILPAGLQRQCELKSVAIAGTAVDAAALVVSVTPDFTPSAAKTAGEVDFSPGAGGGYEASDTTHVMRWLDDIGLAECKAIQLTFADIDVPTATWEMSRISLLVTGGQEAP